MKILLINPTSGPEEEYGALAIAGAELPQLGIASVATSLMFNGYNVEIIETKNLGIDKLLGIIDSNRYDILGFSVYITTVKKTIELSKIIKEKFPKIKICVGGPQVTLSPFDFKNDFIDYIFIGEADFSMIELIKNLEKGVIFPNIRGVLYNDGKQLKGNSSLNLVEDLDSLPLTDLDRLYDMSLFYPPIHIRGKKPVSVVSVRGCPFQCTFCAAAEVNGRKLRKISVTRFVDQIENYANRGYDSFMVYDDTFTIDKKRAILIAQEIIKRKIKISWNCWSRVDCVDFETLSSMKEAGCYYIMYGCESLNDKTLLKLKKGFTAEQCLKGIEIAKKANLLVSSSFMIGLPGETYDDILNTIKEVNFTKLDTALYPIFEPYKGTPIYEVCEQEGHWVKSNYKNRMLIDQEEIWEPNTISRKEIEQLAKYAFRSFYFRPYFLTSFYKIFMKLSLRRKYKIIYAGLDYFIFNKFLWSKKRYQQGSRYR